MNEIKKKEGGIDCLEAFCERVRSLCQQISVKCYHRHPQRRFFAILFVRLAAFEQRQYHRIIHIMCACGMCGLCVCLCGYCNTTSYDNEVPLVPRSQLHIVCMAAHTIHGMIWRTEHKTQCVCDTFITIFLNTSELENFRNKEYMNICSVCVQLLNSYSLIKYEFTSSAMAKPTSIRSKIACYRPSTQKKAL